MYHQNSQKTNGEKICHLTSVHPINDTRIFIKELASIAKVGFDAYCIIVDELDSEFCGINNGIKIIGIKPAKNRVFRMTKTVWDIFIQAKRIKADIYHFHDPELLPIGLLLRLAGSMVIYDVHEDVPKDILSKEYLPKKIRPFLAFLVEKIEIFAAKQCSAICPATPHIANRFEPFNPLVVNINNFPLLGELVQGNTDWSMKKKQVCYVGGIVAIRGIREMVRAMELVQSGAHLALGGRFSEPDVQAEVKTYQGWQPVKPLGWLDRFQVREVLAESMAGLVLFHPLPNHNDAQPNKMFEYMSAGIPVIASNFPLWKEIVEGNQCGICVDPLNSQEIARAIDTLVNDPALAEEMGRNGRRAVEKKYNWEMEEKKLLGLYDQLLTQRRKNAK